MTAKRPSQNAGQTDDPVITCTLDGPDRPEFPAVGDGTCCYGAVIYGPTRCTCWEPVYDVDQAPARTHETPGVQPAMCVDCAYRPKSPERRGDPRAAADADELRRIVDADERFWCHQGMRKPVGYRHPSGVEIDSSPLEYSPLAVDGVPYQADGTPALLCGGWAALRMAAVRRQQAAS